MSRVPRRQSKVSITSILPQGISMRVMRITRTEELKESIRRLCNSGNYELLLLLIDFLVGMGDARCLYNTVPIHARVKDCNFLVYERDEYTFLLFTLDDEGKEDKLCVAFYGIDDADKIYLHPCTKNQMNELLYIIDVSDNKTEDVDVELEL